MSRSRQELILYIRKIEGQLKAVYGNTYAEALKLATVRSAIENGAEFTWKGNPLAERQLNQQLEFLSNRVSKIIYNGITGGWKKGESQVKDEILERFGKKNQTKEVNNVLEDAVKQQRKAGVTAHTFANEKRGGLNVSGRVWNLAGNAKKELEVIIQNGILEGKSADEVTRGLKDYLNEPDRLYRRVKNKETGELELSKAAKSFNPGRGVYRSAYKNALRLAITEINAAYRRAEWQSYQTNSLIIGYRIELSNNHTHVVNGKVRTLYDICDEMVGQYPKTFLWTGWHPHCRCRMVPIFISDADFKARHQARKAGKLNEWRPKDAVTKPPKGFYDWLKNNQERAKGWKNMPSWAKDNKQYIKTNFEVNTYTADEYTFTRARNVQIAMSRAIQELKRLYPKLENTELAAIHHYTRNGGNYRQLNKQLDKENLDNFNRAASSLIRRGLEQLPIYKGTVYRGSIMKQTDYERLYENKNEVTHAIFTSTSMSVKAAERFASYRPLKKNEVSVIFKVHSKTGRNISNISEFNGKFTHEDQSEVLFMSNTRFKIVAKRKDLFGNVTIELEEL